MSNIDGYPTRAEVAEWQSLKLYGDFRARKAADALSDRSRLGRLVQQVNLLADATNYTAATNSRAALDATLNELAEAIESLREAAMMHDAYWDRMAGEHRFRTPSDVFRLIAEKEVDRGRNS